MKRFLFIFVTLLAAPTLLLASCNCGEKPANTTSQPPVSSLSYEQFTVLTAATGEVSLMKGEGSTWAPAAIGTRLARNDSLKTGEAASASVTFFDGSTLDLGPSTQVKVLDLRGSGISVNIRLKQEIGETVSRVAKFVDAASSYEVETAAAVAAVRGSAMLVAVAADGTTSVGNLEGKISVIARSLEVVIPEGMHASVIPGEAPGAPQPGISPPGPDLELGYDSGVAASSLASRGWGYAVKFTPDCAEVIIRGVWIYGQLYGTDHAGKICEIKILDESQNELYSSSFAHTIFTTVPGWHGEVLDTELRIKTPFYVMFFTNSPRTDGLSVFYDSMPNRGSFLMDQWKVMDWPTSLTQPVQNSFNWMIRVTVASADQNDVITTPLAPTK